MANETIRKKARSHKITLWRIAQELGISEATMTRRLRVELPATECTIICEIIDRLAQEV